MSEYQQMQQSGKPDSTFQKQATLASQTHVSHPASIIQRARINPKSLTVADVLQLQRTIGNRDVGRLLSEIRNPLTVQQVAIQRQEIPEEEEQLQGKMIETVQRQTTIDEKTIQMMKFNKKGIKVEGVLSIFASHDTANYEEFKSWIQTLDLDTLRSVATQLSKKKNRDQNEEAAFQAVVAKYAAKKKSHLEEIRPKSLSKDKIKELQSFDEMGIEQAEFDLSVAEKLRGTMSQSEITKYVRGVDQQLQQTFEEADEQMIKTQAISDAIYAGIASIPSMIGTGDEELERELEQLTAPSEEDETKLKVASAPLLEPLDEDEALEHKTSKKSKKLEVLC